LFGCLWSGDDVGDEDSLPFTGWVFLWGAAIVIIWAFALLMGVTIPVLTLILYAPMAAASVHLALQGNQLISREIQELEFDPDTERAIRMASDARQKKFLEKGIWVKLIMYYGFFGVMPALRASLVAGEPDNMAVWGQAFQIIFAMIIMDVIAFAITLLVASVRGNKESVLYSEKIDAELTAAALAADDRKGQKGGL